MIPRWMHMVGLGRVKSLRDDREVMGVQVSQGNTGTDEGESISDDVPMIGLFGFSGAPPIDAEVLMVRLLGDRSQSVAVASSHRPSRPRDLEPGDVCIYDVRGVKILLSAAGVSIDCAGQPIDIANATTVTIKASDKVRVEATSLECTGDVISRADGEQVSLNGLRDAYQAHAHGGVQSGSSSTATTDHDA